MATYQITAPDGGVYEITAPDDATEQEVLTYAQQNYSPTPQQQQTPAVLPDVAKSLGAGAVEGLAAAPALPLSIGAWAGGKLAENLVGKAGQDVDTTSGLGKLAYDYLGKIYGQGGLAENLPSGFLDTANKLGELIHTPQTTGGEYAKTIGAFSSGMVPFAKGATALQSLGQALKQGAVAGIGSETAGQLAEGTEYEPWARLAGAVAVPVAGAAASKAFLPTISEEVSRIGKLATEKYGIPLTLSQLGKSRTMQTAAATAAEVPFSGSQKFANSQIQKWQEGVAKTFGEDSKTITPEVIDNAFTNIGLKFDKALAGEKVPVTEDAVNKLAAIQAELPNKMIKDYREVVENNINRIIDESNGGFITGEKIGQLRSAVTGAIKGVKDNAEAASALGRVRDIIMELGTAKDPAKMELLNTARLQYKNLKTVEPLAAKAVDGYISPALLQSQVARSFPNFVRGGGGELGDLARIGSTFLKNVVPDSGTARRAAGLYSLKEIGKGLAATAGLGGGAALGVSLPALAVGAAAPVALSRLFNTLNASKGAVRKTLTSPQGSALANLVKRLEAPAYLGMANSAMSE